MLKQVHSRRHAALLALLMLTIALLLVGANSAHAAVTLVPNNVVICPSSMSYGENAFPKVGRETEYGSLREDRKAFASHGRRR